MICFRCGKSGHIKCDCQVKEACHRYGKSSHIRPNCWVNLKETKANIVQESKKLKQIT